MSTYRQRIDRLGRCHLAFAVAHCALNPSFAPVTVGSCGDSWKLRRVPGEASNMTENTLSIFIVIFSAQLQQTEISERKLFIFQVGICLYFSLRINTSFLLYILEKNDINKTCRSCFEKMFLFVKIFCQP